MKMTIGHNKTTLIWLIIGNVIKSLTQWGLLVLLIKYYTTKEVGIFTYALALASPVFVLTNMQLKSLLVVEPSGETDNFKIYHAVRCMTSGLTFAGLMVYAIISSNLGGIVVGVFLYKVVESLIDIIYGYYQKKDMMIRMSKFDITKTVIVLLVCLLTTIVLRKIEFTLLSLVVASALFYVIISYDVNKVLSRQDSFCWTKVYDIIKKAFPLGISICIASYMTNYPRLALQNICGPEMLAYFGAYAYLVAGIFQINIPFHIFLRQRLSTSYQHSDIRDFRRKVNLSILFFIGMGAFLVVVFLLGGERIICFLYNKEYAVYSEVLILLIIAETINRVSGILSTAVLSFNIYTKQAIISGFSLAVVVLLSGVVISKYGIWGGGYVCIVAALMLTGCYSYIYLKKLKAWRLSLQKG